MSEDRIYTATDAAPGSFEFSAEVVRVFPDMLRRSIPGYAATIEAIGTLAARFVRPGTRCYDLGCSLGAATLAMRHGIAAEGCEIVAVDNAPAMIARCREAVALDKGSVPVEVVEDDLRNVRIERASMVVMNYTLQFLPPAGRDALVRDIHAGLLPGGVFLLSEKVVHDDPATEELLVQMHHEFKRQNAYTELEISRKRTALENVLVPESLTAHRERLAAAGFRHIEVWLKHFNFASIVAIR